MSLNYISTSEFESKLIPGLKYGLKKLSHGRRIKLNLAAALPLAKVSELQRKLVPIMEEIQRAEEAAKVEPCQCRHPLDPADPTITAKLKEIQDLNIKILSREGTPVELVDVCHSSITKRCIVPGCVCRKPQTDDAIGGYAEHQAIIAQIVDIEDRELVPIYLRNMVEKIQGLDIDGQPATVDTLLEDGAESVLDEVNQEVQRLIKLSPEEVLGFKQPTTSGAVEEGQALVTVP